MGAGRNVVTSMMTRDERRVMEELFREDDRLRAENELRMAQRKSERDMVKTAEGRDRVVERKGDESLVYRRMDNALQAPAGTGVAEGEQDPWAAWNRWVRGHILAERSVIAQALGEVVAEVLKDVRDERARELVERDVKIARLEGMAAEVLFISKKLGEERRDVVAELRAENAELKGFLGELCRKVDSLTMEVADVRARAAAEAERVREIRADVKAELAVLDAKQNEINARYVTLAQHL